MKILYIHTGRLEENKANSIQALQMCRGFVNAGHEVVLAINTFRLSQAEAENAVKEELGTDTLPFELRSYQGSSLLGRAKSLFCIKPVIKFAESIERDVTFIRDPLIYPFLNKHCGPVIFEAHNRIAFPHGRLFNLLWLKTCIKASRNHNTVLFITISKALANWWQEQGVPPEKIAALHDAVDPEIFNPAAGGEKLRNELNLPANKKIVLYAGSLYKDRCIDDILRLAETHPEAFFVVVGGPHDAKMHYEKKSCEDKIENILFTGRVPHNSIPRYLAASDVLLMLWSENVPTINYCSPLKVFEYMAAGRTIVGHGFPTIREVLTDGVDAFLAEPGSFSSLTEKLDQALFLKDSRMGEAARKLSVNKYTWTSRCKTIIEAVKPEIGTEVNCPLCVTSEKQFLCKGNYDNMPIQINICRDCGLVFQSPRASSQVYDRYYSEYYTSTFKPDLERIAAKSIYSLTAERIRENCTIEPKAVLDIGAGAGGVLEHCRSYWPDSNLYAIEPDEPCRLRIQEKTSAKILSDSVMNFPWDEHERNFDIVIMRHVLEHLFDPVEILKSVRSITKDKGYLYVAVPDLAAVPGDVRLRNWWFRFEHTFYFTGQTLLNVVQAAGWEKIISGSHNSETWTILQKTDAQPRKTNIFPTLNKNLRERIQKEQPRELIHSVGSSIRQMLGMDRR